MAPFGAQPEGTGPFSRRPVLPIAYVQRVHSAQGALACTKMAAIAALSLMLTGPNNNSDKGIR